MAVHFRGPMLAAESAGAARHFSIASLNIDEVSTANNFALMEDRQFDAAPTTGQRFISLAVGAAAGAAITGSFLPNGMSGVLITGSTANDTGTLFVEEGDHFSRTNTTTVGISTYFATRVSSTTLTTGVAFFGMSAIASGVAPLAATGAYQAHNGFGFRVDTAGLITAVASGIGGTASVTTGITMVSGTPVVLEIRSNVKGYTSALPIAGSSFEYWVDGVKRVTITVGTNFTPTTSMGAYSPAFCLVRLTGAYQYRMQKYIAAQKASPLSTSGQV